MIHKRTMINSNGMGWKQLHLWLLLITLIWFMVCVCVCMYIVHCTILHLGPRKFDDQYKNTILQESYYNKV